MPADLKDDVFLSHNTQDKPKVRGLAERLNARAVRVWLDEWVARAGEIIGLKMNEGLEQARALLLCISPTTLASGWLGLERSAAIARDPANAGRRFIPLLLGDCALRDTLRRYKAVNFCTGIRHGVCGSSWFSCGRKWWARRTNALQVRDRGHLFFEGIRTRLDASLNRTLLLNLPPM
jgi:hypothetical protein